VRVCVRVRVHAVPTRNINYFLIQHSAIGLSNGCTHPCPLRYQNNGCIYSL